MSESAQLVAGDPTIRQHFVPRFYLRPWVVPKEKYLWCFDMENDNLFKAAPEQVAAENWFYNQPGEDQIAEKALAKLEGQAASAIEKLIKVRDPYALDPDERQVVDLYTIVQMLRTPLERVRKDHMITALREELGPMAVEKLRKELEEADSREFQLGSMGHSASLAKELSHLEAMVIVNDTGVPFTTSDSPVTTHNSFPPTKPFMGNKGIRSFGVEISLPLSPGLELLRFDPRPMEMLGMPRPSRIRTMDQQNLIFQRSKQLFQSRRFLYSSSPDFELEKGWLKAYPEHRDGNRVRIQLGHEGEDNLADKHAAKSKFPPKGKVA